MDISVLTIITLTISACLIIASIKVLAVKGWILGFLRGFGGLILILSAIVVGLGGLNIAQYSSCEEGESIANISFEQNGLQQYNATLVETKSGSDKGFGLDGDMWSIGVSRLKLPLLGRGFCKVSLVSTRYYSLEQQSTRGTTNKTFSTSVVGFDLWALASVTPIPGVQATFEESAYIPLEESVLFSVKQGSSTVSVVGLNQTVE